MILIGKEHTHFFFDCNRTPAATVKPGTEVTFETMDACMNQVRTVEQFQEHKRKGGLQGNPMAGPVHVAGAKPGCTLTVDILKIDLDPEGFQLIGPNRAIVRDEVPEWTCYAFKAAHGRIKFPNGMDLPSDPMIGQYGNASAGEPYNAPSPLGGNMDCPFAKVGARLHIPVEVDGALFSLGDVHARQGDGEVVGAPEIGAKVTVRLDLLPYRQAEGFMIEDAENWHTCWTAENEGEAARQAVFQNAKFLSRIHGAEFKDTLILLTLIGGLTISRTAKWGKHNPVVCSSFSKKLAEEALKGYAASPRPRG